MLIERLNVKVVEILNLSESAVAVVLYHYVVIDFTLTGVIYLSIAIPESNNNAIDVATNS